jgi:hypothetical protein
MHYIKKKKTFSYKSIFINKPINKGYLLFFRLISSFINNQTKLCITNLMTNWKLNISSKDTKHFLLNLMWYVFSILWSIIQNKNTYLFIKWWLRVLLFQENYPNFFIMVFLSCPLNGHAWNVSQRTISIEVLIHNQLFIISWEVCLSTTFSI